MLDRQGSGERVDRLQQRRSRFLIEAAFAENPGHVDGMAGATRSPAWVGLIPRIHCVAATYIQAAAPVSQALRPSPYCGCAGPQMFWQ